MLLRRLNNGGLMHPAGERLVAGRGLSFALTVNA